MSSSGGSAAGETLCRFLAPYTDSLQGLNIPSIDYLQLTLQLSRDPPQTLFVPSQPSTYLLLILYNSHTESLHTVSLLQILEAFRKALQILCRPSTPSTPPLSR